MANSLKQESSAVATEASAKRLSAARAAAERPGDPDDTIPTTVKCSDRTVQIRFDDDDKLAPTFGRLRKVGYVALAAVSSSVLSLTRPSDLWKTDDRMVGRRRRVSEYLSEWATGRRAARRLCWKPRTMSPAAAAAAASEHANSPYGQSPEPASRESTQEGNGPIKRAAWGDKSGFRFEISDVNCVQTSMCILLIWYGYFESL